ncbi:MAG: chemotaxis protein, partial [Deltaproteobacteria bacterium]|nr:chemotaxis protein [Deltaproteobacteria bacterium]
MFKNITIAKRLALGFISLILLTGIVSAVTISYMKELSKFTTKLYMHPYAVSTAVLRIDADMVKIHRAMKDVALAQDNSQIDAAARSVEEYEKQVYKDFEILSARFLGDKRSVEELKKGFADWKPIRDEVIACMRSGERQKGADITKGKGAEHVAFLNKNIK